MKGKVFFTGDISADRRTLQLQFSENVPSLAQPHIVIPSNMVFWSQGYYILSVEAGEWQKLQVGSNRGEWVHILTSVLGQVAILHLLQTVRRHNCPSPHSQGAAFQSQARGRGNIFWHFITPLICAKVNYKISSLRSLLSTCWWTIYNIDQRFPLTSTTTKTEKILECFLI